MRKMLFFAMLVCGCDAKSTVQNPIATVSSTVTPPDDASNGPRYTVKGRVLWKGSVPKPPDLPPIFGKIEKLAPPLNPYFPQIDAETKGLKNTVVYVELFSKWKPELPKRNLQLGAEEHRLFFGAAKAPIAVTTIGSEIELKPKMEKLTLIRTTGALFFSLAFPNADTVHNRVFKEKGIVEFSNASSDYWATCRAYVFDHPWYAITDEKGFFEIKDVPLGEINLVCEVADWRMEKYERDPDTQAIMRLEYKQPIKVQERKVLNADFEWNVEIEAKP